MKIKPETSREVLLKVSGMKQERQRILKIIDKMRDENLRLLVATDSYEAIGKINRELNTLKALKKAIKEVK